MHDIIQIGVLVPSGSLVQNATVYVIKIEFRGRFKIQDGLNHRASRSGIGHASPLAGVVFTRRERETVYITYSILRI